MAFDTQAVLGGGHSDLHYYHKLNSQKMGTSLVAHWLRLCPPSAGCTGSIPGRGIKIPHAVWCGQKKVKNDTAFQPASDTSEAKHPHSLTHATSSFHIVSSSSLTIYPSGVFRGYSYLLQKALLHKNNINSSHHWASLVAQMVKNPPAMWETWVQSLGWEDPLEEGMATHSSILACRIPMGRGAWQATVHGVTKSRTWLKQRRTEYPITSAENIFPNLLLAFEFWLVMPFLKTCILVSGPNSIFKVFSQA